jgi:hypothetical protein
MKESTTAKLGPLSNPATPDDASDNGISSVFDHGELIDAALGDAVRDALSFHKRMGNPIAAWSDGKVVWLKPSEI